VGAKPAKSISQIDMAYDILRNAGRPLHISEIMTLVAKRHGVTLDRESIVSALAKRVARKDRFVRTGPNIFSILPDTER
jgi:DNA-directed RNA polymerase delta subunit